MFPTIIKWDFCFFKLSSSIIYFWRPWSGIPNPPHIETGVAHPMIPFWNIDDDAMLTIREGIACIALNLSTLPNFKMQYARDKKHNVRPNRNWPTKNKETHVAVVWLGCCFSFFYYICIFIPKQSNNQRASFPRQINTLIFQATILQWRGCGTIIRPPAPFRKWYIWIHLICRLHADGWSFGSEYCEKWQAKEQKENKNTKKSTTAGV